MQTADILNGNHGWGSKVHIGSFTAGGWSGVNTYGVGWVIRIAHGVAAGIQIAHDKFYKRK